jgi:hypothetical protein
MLQISVEIYVARITVNKICLLIKIVFDDVQVLFFIHKRCWTELSLFDLVNTKEI